MPRPEPMGTYARPARRQASTPDIPRGGRYFPPEEIAHCTFGVVLDTSGSMGVGRRHGRGRRLPFTARGPVFRVS